MGFLDGLASVGKAALNSMNEYNGRMQALKATYEDKSSEELMRIVKDDGFFGKSKEERAMAYRILKERGEI